MQGQACSEHMEVAQGVGQGPLHPCCSGGCKPGERTRFGCMQSTQGNLCLAMKATAALVTVVQGKNFCLKRRHALPLRESACVHLWLTVWLMGNLNPKGGI